LFGRQLLGERSALGRDELLRGMATNREERVARLLDGLSASGYRPAEAFDPQAQPLDLLVARGRDQLRLRVFSWSATPGGPPGVRARGEMRVQTTRPGRMRLLGSRKELTLLLGYDDRRDVFAAWDARHHPDPGGSSSLQVDAATLDEAAQEGFAAQARRISGGEEEVVLAFQPEAIGAYLETAPGLPGPRESQRAVRAAARAASGEAVPLEELPEEENDGERFVGSSPLPAMPAFARACATPTRDGARSVGLTLGLYRRLISNRSTQEGLI
jgi:hypothetical protein